MSEKNTVITEKIPNKAYDLEYGTQYKKEVAFLSNCGFKYTFVKRNEFGVKTYKYTKTPQLFRAISIFYETQRNNKQFEFYKKKMSAQTTEHDTEFLADVIKQITKEAEA